MKERVNSQVNLLKMCKSPFINKLLDCKEDSENYYLMLDLCEYPSLKVLLQEIQLKEKTIPVEVFFFFNLIFPLVVCIKCSYSNV
jgi:serine/threonine protein kinase